jgi:hypothetical protein
VRNYINKRRTLVASHVSSVAAICPSTLPVKLMPGFLTSAAIGEASFLRRLMLAVIVISALVGAALAMRFRVLL